MHARVTAILVARTGAAYLDRTLAGLARQTRRPEALIAVDVASTDGGSELLAAAGPTQLVSAQARSTFGAAIARALHVAGGAPSENDWLWLLAHDTAPEPAALEQLLAAVEIAPSVAIAGPKLMRWEQPDVITDFGETITRFGASIRLVDGELDQAQHDVQDDVLGVAAEGMLIRRSVWTALGGFDPGLPSVDAGLDLSIRARLAGYRVIVVPGAKMASAGGPEHFGRKSVSERRRASVTRAAQLHRRLVYSPGGALFLHWLSLVPLGVLRAIGQLLAKRPGAIGGEISTAFRVAFGGTGVGAARSNLRRTRRLGWASVAALRMPSSEVRERRGQAREAAVSLDRPARETSTAGFVTHGGLLVVVLAAIIGVVAWVPLLGSSALTGGGLLPMSGSVGELWSHVGYGSRDIGLGTIGAADPFAYVLALLGTITFWSPSFSILLVSVLALPLAALGAWFAARRLSRRPWLPALAAVLWAVAPPLLGSLGTGHLGATIAHLLLPWLVLAALSATRSWSAAAGAGLLFAAVTASAPILAPALLLCWLAWLFSQPKSTHRLIGIPIPAAALFAPLVVQQFLRGTPLDLFAEPGVPAAGVTDSGWQLALGSPGVGLNGWTAVAESFGLSAAAAPIIVAVLLVPVGLFALAGLFVRGSQRAIPSMVIALLGFLTAVAATHLAISVTGSTAVAVWPGAALSLFWLGLIGGLLVALDGIGRVAVPLGVLSGVTAALLAIPLLGTLYLGTATVHTAERILPAVVTANAEGEPRIGTLVLSPLADGGLAATVQRGAGTTLDDQSTLVATDAVLGAPEKRIATLAGNLASRSGYDESADLRDLELGFVVLTPAETAGGVHQRAADALDNNAILSPVGTTADGLLWQFTGSTNAAGQPLLSNTGSGLGVGILVGQAAVFGITILLGIPTVRRRRRTATTGATPGEPAGTFDEDDHDD